jgi:hypothetical protein
MDAVAGRCNCRKWEFIPGGVAKIYSARIFHEVSARLLRSAIAGVSLLVAGALRSSPVPTGILEGQLTIVSLKEVQRADEPVSKFAAVNYGDYPLLVLSKDGQTEIARLVADEKGHYRVTLPPGDYVLDVKGRAPQRIRAKPHPFTIVSQQTVRVDMELDTGVR